MIKELSMIDKNILDLASYIDHTALSPGVKEEGIHKLCQEAVYNNFFAVCINPVWVKPAKSFLKNSNVKLATVIGFPLGENTSMVKHYEAEEAINNGADELDMVINVSELKSCNTKYLQNEISSIVKLCSESVLLKVIIETDLLTLDEKILACKICIDSGASFVKTSTGFVKNGMGATIQDVSLIQSIVSEHGLKVKASGGIRDKQQALDLIKAGASRIGTSSGLVIIA